MRPWIALFGALTLLLPAGAGAGPWPREAGTWFLSPSVGVERSDGLARNFVDLYGEHGLSPRITATGRVRLAMPGRDWRDGVVEFDSTLRWHPPELAFGIVTAVEAGLRGVAQRNRDPAEIELGGGVFVEERSLQTGFAALVRLHAGRGLDTRFGPGWVRGTLELTRPVDLKLERLFIREESRKSAEIMLQAGVRPTDDWLGMVTLSAFQADGETFVKIFPAVGRRVAPGREVLVELMAGTGGGSQAFGIRLGLWQSF
jgi:hypothetical protein